MEEKQTPSTNEFEQLALFDEKDDEDLVLDKKSSDESKELEPRDESEGESLAPSEVEGETPPPAPAEEQVPAEPQPEQPPAAEQPKEQPKVEQPPAQPPAEQPIDHAAARQAFLEELERSYAFTPEDAERVNEQPAQALPKLAARLHTDVYESVVRTIYAQLPQALDSYVAGRQQVEKVTQSFYEEFPELKGHEQAVGQVGKVWRQINPSAPMEQAVKAIGVIAMQQLGLSRKPAPAQPQPVPHMPVSPGGSVASPSRPKPNIFEELAMHVDDGED